uniref:Uncharacterized protein n=1 Tax=Scleropages formosus TaxID=113540 RepID=A0A8C9RL31_SCLFO
MSSANHSHGLNMGRQDNNWSNVLHFALGVSAHCPRKRPPSQKQITCQIWNQTKEVEKVSLLLLAQRSFAFPTSFNFE